MDFKDFKIGSDFYTGAGKWRCTDIGTRVIVAIHLNEEDDSWYDGPPYPVTEHVFHEYEIQGCVETESEAFEEFGEDYATILTHRKKRIDLDEDDLEGVFPVWKREWVFSTSKHKGFEIEFIRWPRNGPFADLQFNLHRRCDHPGVELILVLFRFEFGIHYSDSRHWDRKTNQLI